MDSIKYSFLSSILTRQAESEDAMMKDFESGNYTIENPLVTYNPYLINPLAAVVLFNTDQAVAVTITVRGKDKHGNIKHTFPKATTHILPILGLYGDYNNTVEIQLYRGYTKTVQIQTDPLGNDVPKLVRMETTPGYLEDQLIIVSPALTQLASGFDYNGEIRWYLNIPTVFDIKRLNNGNISIGSHRLLQMPYYMSGLYEMSMVGKIYKEFAVPGGYHHDQVEMEDGNLLVLSEDLRSETVEDMLVLIDRTTGDILKSWDFKDFLEPGCGKSGSWSAHDWFHNNAVWYDKNTNSITLSGRHIDAVVNIDYDSSALNWIIGDPAGWPEKYQKYFFKPIGNGEFDWQYEQHACVITPDGDVMCFDNGHWRAKDKEHYLLNKDNFSRGVRYKINTDDMTIEQVWQFGKERGQHFFSQYICNVEYYEEGHYMIHSGGIQYYKGEASEQFAALMQDDPDVSTRSITVEVLDDQVMLELEVEGNFYRAEKLRLYHDQETLTIGHGAYLGKLGISKEFDTDIPMESSNILVPERYESEIIEEDDRFTYKAIFEKGQLVMLMLEQGEEKHRYYISTAAKQFEALCCGTFITKDARAVTLSVNKEGLSGTYDAKIIVDDEKYETGVQLHC